MTAVVVEYEVDGEPVDEETFARELAIRRREQLAATIAGTVLAEQR